jgi:TPR repeat protein
LWIRGANQGHVDARVKVGDYFYYGYGILKVPSPYSNATSAPVVDEEKQAPGISDKVSALFVRKGGVRHEPDHQIAAAHYSSAADLLSSMAQYNLGFMHENGLGVAQVYSHHPGLPFSQAILRFGACY